MSVSSLLHPRNAHADRYDLELLASTFAPLKKFIFTNKYGAQTIDFKNDQAVTHLNTALLMHYYQVAYWHLPKGYLCPAIPGRADYVHYLADLLGQPKPNRKVSLLDIGCGANLVYPIIASQCYQWRVTGAELDQLAFDNASDIIAKNDLSIDLRRQQHQNAIFDGIIGKNGVFDVTMCNPPFHQSAFEARSGSRRKWQNLGQKEQGDALNFGGQANELWCEGGEVAFVRKMIMQSEDYKMQVLWFTSLVSKNDHLTMLKASCEHANAKQVKVVEMHQGQKSTRFLAWSFFDAQQEQQWKKLRLA